MQRVVVTRRGGPEVLQLIKGPAPEPRWGELRIRVEAAGVAFGDVLRRRLDPRTPYTPGYEVVGRVESSGAGACGDLAGVRVGTFMPRVGIGGYTQQACVPTEMAVRIPESMDAGEAVALGLNYVSAYQLLHRVVPLGPGQRILFHGLGGGVGTAVLELARRLGVEVYGTAAAAKHTLIRSLGGTPIDYREEDFVGWIIGTVGGVEAAYDPIGGSHPPRSYRTLSPGGTLVAFGAATVLWRGPPAAAETALHLARLRLRPDGKRVLPYAFSRTRGCSLAASVRDWQHLLGLRSEGVVEPLIAARLPLSAAKRAHEMLEAGGVIGKIVLLPEQDPGAG